MHVDRCRDEVVAVQVSFLWFRYRVLFFFSFLEGIVALAFRLVPLSGPFFFCPFLERGTVALAFLRIRYQVPPFFLGRVIVALAFLRIRYRVLLFFC